jgi:hypothetical protein
VFVEAAPVAFKGDATGNFRRIVIGAEPPEEPDDEVFAPPPPASPPPAAPAPKAAATPTSSARPRVTAPPPPSPSPVTAAPSRPPAKPVASSTPPPRSAPPSRPPPPPPRDSEDQQIDSDLRSLAAKLGGTASRPAPKFLAANDEAIQRELSGDDNRDTGDIYAKAVPRPREPARPPAPATAQRFPARQNFSLVANDAIDDDEAEIQAVDGAAGTFTPARPPRSRVTLWISGAALLSLALVAQAVHHNRHDLATNALLNRPLVRFYRAIGVPLVPSWDLRSYDVRQLGASSSEGGDGTLTVRASLKNNAKQPLPLPLLRITMQDRYGNRIATRDVLPAGYVPGAVPAEAHLGVGQRIDAEMTFKDPGQSAVGFEIDACLATASGRIACANDAAVAAR